MTILTQMTIPGVLFPLGLRGTPSADPGWDVKVVASDRRVTCQLVVVEMLQADVRRAWRHGLDTHPAPLTASAAAPAAEIAPVSEEASA